MRRLFILGALLALLIPTLALAQGPDFTAPMFSAVGDVTSPPQLQTLSKMTATGTMQAATSSDTAVNLWVCIAACGSGLPGQFVMAGQTACLMDATASGVGGQFIVVSPTAPPKCHATPTAPSAGMVNGILTSGSTTVNQAATVLANNQPYVPGSVSGGGVNTGTVNRPAIYSTTTTVGSSAAAPTANRAYIGDGTNFVTSTVDMAGAGVCVNQFMRSTSATAPATCATVGPGDVTTGIALTGQGINTSSQPEYAPGTWAFTGADTSSISSDISDYGSCPTMICQVTAGGTGIRNWTGLLAATRNGTMKQLCSATASTNLLRLRDQNSGSSAINRFAIGSDLTLRPGQCRSVWYDLPAQRWKLWEGTIRDPYKIRSCTFPFGSKASSATALDASDDMPRACRNDTQVDVTITAVALSCDGGASKFNPILTGSGVNSILSSTGGTCTCGAADTVVTCPLNGTPVLHSFALDGTCSTPPCDAAGLIDTADGVTKYALLTLIWSLP